MAAMAAYIDIECQYKSHFDNVHTLHRKLCIRESFFPRFGRSFIRFCAHLFDLNVSAATAAANGHE